jgi:cell division protein FtsW (lipid II flippase)
MAIRLDKKLLIRYGILLSIAIVILCYNVFYSSGLNYNYIELQEVEAEIEKPNLIIGSSSQADIVFVDDYIASKHARLSFGEHSFTITNISDDKKISVDDTYLNSIPIDKGDTLSVFDESYVFLHKPVLIGIGLFGQVIDKNGNKQIFGNMKQKFMRLNKLFSESSLASKHYLQVEYISLSWRILHDAIVLLLAALGIIILYLFIKNSKSLWLFISKREICHTSSLRHLFFAILAFIILFSISLLLRNTYTVNIKSSNYQRDDYENLFINNEREQFISKRLGYNTDFNVILGYTNFVLSVKKNETYHTVTLTPSNSRFFFSDKHPIITNSAKTSQYNLPYLQEDSAIKASGYSDTLKIEQGDKKYEIFVNSIKNYMNKYYLFILYFLLLNVIMLLFSYYFRFDYEYFLLFSFILLQGIIIMEQYSFLHPADFKVYPNFIRNIQLGFAFFSIVYFLLNIRWFIELEDSIDNTSFVFRKIHFKLIQILPLLFFFNLFVFFMFGLFDLILLISMLLITTIFIGKRVFDLKTSGNLVFFKMSYSPVNSESKYDSKCEKTKLDKIRDWQDMAPASSEPIITPATYKVIMHTIIFTMLLQFIKGDELGFNFLGTNFQFLELFKIVILFVIILGYLNLHKAKSGHALNAWITILPIMTILSFLIGDFSPVIIFFIVFCFNALHYLIGKEDNRKYLLLLLPPFLLLGFLAIPYFHYLAFIIFIFFITFQVLIPFLKKYDLKRKYKISFLLIVIFLLGLLALFFFQVIPLSLPGKVNEKLYRFYYWWNPWQTGNYQFLRSMSFLKPSSILPNMRFVPILKDDMFFSLYINRFGFWGFVLGFLVPIGFLLYKAKENYQFIYDDENRKWLSFQILFISILFFAQNFIVLSNVTGLLPIMGQPAPGLSYSGSNLIFFFFGSFFLLVKMKKEFLSFYKN